MDKKLLDALSNISDGIDALVEALKDNLNNDNNSSLNQPNFQNSLESISATLKDIKSDTKKILKNQETLVSISKEKEENKNSKFKFLDNNDKNIKNGASKEKEENKNSKFKFWDNNDKNIKNGAATILLIAASILAIGLAFKLIGKVDFLSVISISLSITLIAITYEKISKLKLEPKQAILISSTLVIMTMGIFISSFILSSMSSVSVSKMITSIFISGLFVIISYGLSKILNSFKGMAVGDVKKTAIFLPLIMPVFALSIALSSAFFALVYPIKPASLFTSIMISAIFVGISYSIKNIVSSLKDVDGKKVKEMGIILPLILPAMALSIAASSWVLSTVVPITFSQFLTGIGISIMFIGLSYGISKILSSVGSELSDKNKIISASWGIPLLYTSVTIAISISSAILSLVVPISPGQLLTAIGISAMFVLISYSIPNIMKSTKDVDPEKLLMIPIMYTTVSIAIMLSSVILSKSEMIPPDKILSILELGLALGAVSFAMGVIINWFSKANISPENIIKGSFVILAIATTLVASSVILSKSEMIPPDKILSILELGLALGAVSFAMGVIINWFSKANISPENIIKGSFVILAIATTLVASSLILSFGDYNKYPSVDWSLGVGLSLLSFGVGAFALGALVFGPQALIFLAGLGSIVAVSGVIVSVSKILKSGDYSYSSSLLEWAKGTALIYATFVPIIGILGVTAIASSVLSIFGVNPWKMAKTAMVDIADTISEVSIRLQSGNYKKGPTEEWANGISIALGSFSPIYKMLADNSTFSLFRKNISIEDYKNAILTISDGIISAANKFSESNVVFKNGPSKEWAEGVGSAIGAFSPVYKILSENNSLFGVSADDMKNAISIITQSIVDSANIFSNNSSVFNNNYPSVEWGKGVSSSISAFSPVFDLLNNSSWYKTNNSVIKDASYAIKSITNSILSSALSLSGYEWNWLTQKWEKLDVNMSSVWSNYPKPDWSNGIKDLIISYSSIFDKLGDKDHFKEKTKNIKSRLLSMVSVAKLMWLNKTYLNDGIGTSFVDSLSSSMLVYDSLLNNVSNSAIDEFKEKTKNIKSRLLSMVSVAKLMWLNKTYLSNKIGTSFIDSLSSNVLVYDSLLNNISNSVTKNSNYKVNNLSGGIIRLAKLFYSNQQYFESNIDPNYVKNISQNILDYNVLMSQLVNYNNGDLLSSLKTKTDDVFGDPVIKMSQRMITLAKGYDAISNSLIKLSGALKAVNISDVKELNNIISSDPGKSNNINLSGPNSTLNNVITKDLSGGNYYTNDSISSKLDEIINILSNIDKSSLSLNSMVADISDGSGEAPNKEGNGILGSFF